MRHRIRADPKKQKNRFRGQIFQDPDKLTAQILSKNSYNKYLTFPSTCGTIYRTVHEASPKRRFVPQAKITIKYHACIVKCEREKTIEYCFFEARRPKARNKPSRRLAKATVCDYATVAEYNKPLLRVRYIQEDRPKHYRDRLKHYKNFVF